MSGGNSSIYRDKNVNGSLGRVLEFDSNFQCAMLDPWLILTLD